MDLRDIFILSALLVIAPLAVRRPQIGMLGWLWISIMNPHKEAYGFIHNMPVLDGLAGLTILGCIIHWKDRAQVEFSPVLKLVLVFYIWICLTTLFAINPVSAFYDWLEFSKTLLLIFLMCNFLNKRHWIIAAVGVFILALSYTAMKGGLFTIITGGAHRVWGPANAVWGSNNGVSLAMVMLVPLAVGFAKVFEKRLLQLACYGIGFLAFVTVLGTQSRGGLVGLVAMGGAMILRTRRKALAFILVPIILLGGAIMMPDRWSDRMATILTPSEDGSASTRLIQWKYAIDISMQRPLFGNGFESFFYQPYYNRFVGSQDKNRAVHSNIFQILGEQGPIGLGMYISIFALLVLTAKKHSDMARTRLDLQWASSILNMLQFSIIGCAANGLTLNLAYLDLFYYLLVFTALLVSYVRMEMGFKPGEPSVIPKPVPQRGGRGLGAATPGRTSPGRTSPGRTSPRQAGLGTNGMGRLSMRRSGAQDIA